MQWVDFRLQYHTSYNESSELELDSEAVKKIWVPSIYFPSAKKTLTSKSLSDNIKMTIFENGTVKYSQRFVSYLNPLFCGKNIAAIICTKPDRNQQ